MVLHTGTVLSLSKTKISNFKSLQDYTIPPSVDTPDKLRLGNSLLEIIGGQDLPNTSTNMSMGAKNARKIRYFPPNPKENFVPTPSRIDQAKSWQWISSQTFLK